MDALVITPFSPINNNAGHRIRTRETIENLSRVGIINVDIIYIPFEGEDAYSFASQAELRFAPFIRDVYHYPFITSIGAPPENGSYHSLDEWYDSGLDDFLLRLSRRKRYDLVMVHNVWLSKALAMFGESTIKCIETHDIFWMRGQEFEKIGIKPDFFSPQEKDELYGLNRADLLIAISYVEAQYFSQNFPNKKIIYQPPPVTVSYTHLTLPTNREV